MALTATILILYQQECFIILRLSFNANDLHLESKGFIENLDV
ncbi:hypothetical protein MJ1HA_1413 [Metallosphaera sedula]|nr:hypothetical protein MJ1HA_1413 [Metallosphaera sedula]